MFKRTKPPLTGASDLSNWLQIEKSGAQGILRIDETGAGTNCVDLALIRGGHDLTIEELADANAL